ncbi:MerR family transcriptional regulator [candidate division WWE3 bacterium]|nr:MerR family transcriptional regulator [candidate division WWE3 bacterium]
MSLYISAEKLIETAKSNGINLGKGNPYNRLRYYTKIGWLPHMERMKNENSEVVGHYPNWSINRLELIESLKASGKTNEQIEKALKSVEAKQNIRKIFSFLDTPEKRTSTVVYLTFFLILGTILLELGIFSGGLNAKQNLLNQIRSQSLPARILETGTSFIPARQKTFFIPSSIVTQESRISVTFESSFTPASKYWVSKKIDNQGFYLELDAATSQDATFNWFIAQ